MSKLKLILKSVPIGLDPTPKQSAQRKKFAHIAKECQEVFRDSKVKGAAKIRAMNQYMSQHLKET